MTPHDFARVFADQLCSCVDIEKVLRFVWLLLHSNNYDPPVWEMLRIPEGAFYLIENLLDEMGLVVHGASARHPMLTHLGGDLLYEFGKHDICRVVEAYEEIRNKRSIG